MASRDIYKDDIDFAVLALQSPAFNKQLVCQSSQLSMKTMTNARMKLQLEI